MLLKGGYPLTFVIIIIINNNNNNNNNNKLLSWTILVDYRYIIIDRYIKKLFLKKVLIH